MADLYRNIGAPIRRNGVTVAHRGDVFEPTTEELVRLRYKLHKVEAPARRQPAAKPESAGVEVVAPAAPAAAEPDPATASVDDYHTGAGWYTLPGGERVRGKSAALEALGLTDADQD